MYACTLFSVLKDAVAETDCAQDLSKTLTIHSALWNWGR